MGKPWVWQAHTTPPTCQSEPIPGVILVGEGKNQRCAQEAHGEQHHGVPSTHNPKQQLKTTGRS